MTAKNSFEALKAEYARLWDSMRIDSARAGSVDATARRIIKQRNRYEAVAATTGVPWWVIALIHALEASLNFSKHLHNGDPLGERTVRRPAGRPPFGAPPFTWEESATDAIELKNLRAVTEWTVERFAYQMEKYNGFGYRSRTNVNSPYLWSFSNHYTKGKFVKDGKFDPEAISKQAGAMPLLRTLADLSDVALAREDLSNDFELRSSSYEYPGRVIRLNASDAQRVRIIQTRLNDLGFGPIPVDGDFDSATESAVKSFQARATAPDGADLTVDGIVGPKTWAALFGTPELPENLPAQALSEFLKQVIRIAKAEADAGVAEDPPGSNRGKRVEEYQRAAGYEAAVPWCVCFLYWCFSEGARVFGASNPMPRTGSVHRLWSLARSKGFSTIPAIEAQGDPTLVHPGAVFFIDSGQNANGDRVGHAGLVISRNADVITTIEGNTDEAGGRAGWRVLVRRRLIRKINMGFVLIDS